MSNVPDYSQYIAIKKIRTAQSGNASSSALKGRSVYRYDGYFPLYRGVRLPVNALLSNKFVQPPGGVVDPCAPPDESATYTYSLSNPGGSGSFWYDIAMSANDGSVIIAGTNGGAYISTTGGTTGLTIINPGGTNPNLPPLVAYGGAAVNASGNVIAVSPDSSSNKFWVSKDRGVTWTSTLLFSGGFQGEACITDDGQIIGVFTTNGTYISRDGGTSYTLYSTPSGRRGFTCSCDGKYMITAAQGARVSLSSDYGFTWTTVSALPVAQWFDVDCSKDGRVIITCAYTSGSVYVSTDYGQTWSQKTSIGSRDWGGVACSAGGKYMVAVAENATNAWISQDTGATWNTINLAQGAGSIDMTADGKKIYLGSAGNYGTPRIITGV